MYRFVRKCLFQLDPETAHNLVIVGSTLMPHNLINTLTSVDAPCLKTKIGSAEIQNPIGMAAGFDKNAELLNLCFGLGFGFTEIGSVTAEAHPGNPRPRVFRLPFDQSLINRMGLPNVGAELLAKHLSHKKCPLPYGINIAKTPTSLSPDFLSALITLKNFGAYFVFNLSCPNTGAKKLFEDPDLFNDLAPQIAFARREHAITKPLLIKLSADLDKSRLQKVVELAIKYELDGFVISNTTQQRSGLKTAKATSDCIGNGGLSGPGMRHLATEQIKRVYEMVGKTKLIVGCGGICTLADVLEKLSAGASLLQLYTSLVYQGPLLIKRLNTELVAFCKKCRVVHYQELIGQPVAQKAT